jgi:hypothetical protein
MFFKTNSSSREALLTSLKPSLSMLEVYKKRKKLYWIKPKYSIRVLQQHFEDKSNVLFKASNHQFSLRNSCLKLYYCKAQILA